MGALAGGVVGAFVGGLISCVLLFWAFPQFCFSHIQPSDSFEYFNNSGSIKKKGTLRMTLGGRLRYDPPPQITTPVEDL